jgi:hypothetical protein
VVTRPLIYLSLAPLVISLLLVAIHYGASDLEGIFAAYACAYWVVVGARLALHRRITISLGVASGLCTSLSVFAVLGYLKIEPDSHDPYLRIDLPQAD